MSLAALLRNRMAVLAIVGASVLLLIMGPMADTFNAAAVGAPDPETSLNAFGLNGYLQLVGGVAGRGETFITSGESPAGGVGQNGVFESQRVFISSKIQAVDGYADADICQIEYKAFLEGAQFWSSGILTPGGGKSGFAKQGALYELPPADFVVEGQVVGRLRVELHAFVEDNVARKLPFYGGCNTWARLAYDGAIFRDGAGALRLVTKNDLYQEGERVDLEVKTGYGHWFVEVLSGTPDGKGKPRCEDIKPQVGTLSWTDWWADHGGREWYDDRDYAAPDGSAATTPGQAEYNPNALPNYSGNSPSTSAAWPSCANAAIWSNTGERPTTQRFSFVIPEGAFVPGCATCNVWRITLKNTLVEHSTEQVVTVDKRALAPAPPVVKFAPAIPKAGETVSFEFTAKANPNGKPVERFYVQAWYGMNDLLPTFESPNWITSGLFVPAVQTGNASTGTWSFVAQKDAVQWRVMAVDSDGRMSGSCLGGTQAKELADVYGSAVNACSRGEVRPAGSGNPGPKDPLGSSSSSALLVLLVAGVAAVAAWYFLPVSPAIKVAVVGGILVVAFGFGVWGAA